MTEIPKEGWSCNSCRTCSECGNKANHSGQAVVTDDNILCIDCQRLRNKNECCICSKDTLDDSNVYKCNECLVSVHEDCELDKPDSSNLYKCPKCRLGQHQNFDVSKGSFSSKRNRKLSDNSDNSDSIFTDEGLSDRLSEELQPSDLAEDSDDLRGTPSSEIDAHATENRSKNEPKIEPTLTPKSDNDIDQEKK